MRAVYKLDPPTLRLLEGRTVHVDPWEIALAWYYGLRWRPLPVFQDYSAYTASLDRLNAGRLDAAGGPERVVRENTALVDPQYPQPTIDGRLPAWDPPAQSLALLCNYAPLRTTARWQVLGKVRDRCGPPQLIRSLHVRDGQTVTLPAAGDGGAVFIRIRGAGVSGRERLRALLYRARARQAVLNGTQAYRLIPGTAGDGLITSIPRTVDFPGPFSLSPDVRTIAITGVGRSLGIDVFRMTVAGAGTRR
jgi:hypothetical protein